MSTKIGYPKTLFNQSLLTLAYDDVVFLHLPRIKDVPKRLLRMLAKLLSAYGLCLLEYNGVLLKNDSTNELWKLLYFQITNRYYEPMSKINSTVVDMKQLYFQRVFHEVLQCFYGEVVLNDQLQKSCQDTRLFHNSSRTAASMNLDRLKELFQNQLTTIRMSPRVLKNLHFTMSESCFFQQFMISIEGIELRDFKYFKEDELEMLNLILQKRIIPKLSKITFVNCKFNSCIMKWFGELTDKFSIANRSENYLKTNDGNKLQKKQWKHKENQSMNEKVNHQDVPFKKAKFDENRDISFDEVICFNKPKDVLKIDDDLDNSDHCFDLEDLYDPMQNISSITQLGFVNCHFDQEAVYELCCVVQKMSLLKSFTFCPEWKHNLNCADKILPSMLEQSQYSRKNTMLEKVFPVIEEIKIESCPLGFYSQKLLLWHQKGECITQYGVCVPKPKHLKITDCDLRMFWATCSCHETEDGISDDSKREFTNTSKCDGDFIWNFEAQKFCSCNWVNLVTVDFSENKIGMKGAAGLAQALETACSLESIKLSECFLDTKGCSIIFDMAAKKKNLKSLDISNNTYDGRKDSGLRNLIENGTVCHLILRCLFVPDGFTTGLVESFSKNSSLKSLDLSTNRLSDEVFCTLIQVMADQSALSSLECLDLSRNLFEVTLLPEFANSLESSNRQLKELRVSGNISNIKDERFSDIIERCVAKFSDEDSEIYHLRRDVNGLADYVSVM